MRLRFVDTCLLPGPYPCPESPHCVFILPVLWSCSSSLCIPISCMSLSNVCPLMFWSFFRCLLIRSSMFSLLYLPLSFSLTHLLFSHLSLPHLALIPSVLISSSSFPSFIWIFSSPFVLASFGQTYSVPRSHCHKAELIWRWSRLVPLCTQ